MNAPNTTLPTAPPVPQDGPEAAEDNEHQDQAPEGVQVDMEAPYGRTATGKPKGKPGRKPGASSRGRRTSSSGPTAPPRKRATAARKPPAGPDYHGGLRRALGVPVGILTALGGRKPVFRADAMAVVMHGPKITDAVADMAEADPRLAGILDRFLQATPAAEIITAISPLVVQIAVNHGTMPVEMGKQMGAEDPDTLVKVYTRHLAAQAAEAAGAA